MFHCSESYIASTHFALIVTVLLLMYIHAYNYNCNYHRYLPKINKIIHVRFLVSSDKSHNSWGDIKLLTSSVEINLSHFILNKCIPFHNSRLMLDLYIYQKRQALKIRTDLRVSKKIWLVLIDRSFSSSGRNATWRWQIWKLTSSTLFHRCGSFFDYLHCFLI